MVTPPTDGVDPQFGGGRGGRRCGRLAIGALVAMALLVTASNAPPESSHVHRATSAAAAISVAAPPAPTSPASVHGPFELTEQDRPSKPLQWLACRPIDFVINPADMPEGMDDVIRDAMASVADQTAVRFHDAGWTKRRFASTERPARPTIYFAFTPKRHAYGHTFAYPGEIGVGGPTGAWYRDDHGERYEAITSGRVLLSTSFRGERRGPGATWQSLIVHETGHALNLAHRPAARDAMNAVLGERSPGRFQPAEVRALKRVLQRTGCDYRAWSRL